MKFLLFWLGLGLVGGCNSRGELRPFMDQLQKKQQALFISQQESQQRVEDLSNSILILQDRLETLKVAVEKQPSASSVSSKKEMASKTMEVSSDEPVITFFGVGDVDNEKFPQKKWTNKDLEKGSSHAQSKSILPPTLPKKITSEREVDDPNAGRAYTLGYRKFEEGQFMEAIPLLTQFVQKYPDHVYADNAIFWMGESYIQLQEYEKAAQMFERVIKEYPSGNKVPEALLKAGTCYVKVSKLSEARRFFEQLTQQFPKSISAQEAKVSLSNLQGSPSKGRM